jgi:hypothetical protein
MDPVRRIADAVLYEGYALWPYRRSALKNQQRWTFGGVHPRAYSEQRGGDDPWIMQAQCLLEGGPDTTFDVHVRFLHVVERQVLRAGADRLEPVDELELDGERHVSWQEATEREAGAEGLTPGSSRRMEIRVEPGIEREELRAADGTTAGALDRSWKGLAGALAIAAESAGAGVHRVTVRISNTTPWEGGSREHTLRQTFCSPHAVLRTHGGSFVSLTDPPADMREAAKACENEGCWPVLVGEQGDRGTLLASPIILPDYPQIAPESPGDLFDSGEIDQMLVLNILAMTDEEKQAMREADPRTREILERTEALSEEELMRLHGAIREFAMVREP